MQIHGNKLLSTYKRMAMTWFAVLEWTVFGATIGAAGGGYFGVFCGAIEGLVHADLRRVVWMILYTMLCGALAGAILTAFATVIDREAVADLTSRSPQDYQQQCDDLIWPNGLLNRLTARWWSSKDANEKASIESKEIR
jgi:hypothetical protein